MSELWKELHIRALNYKGDDDTFFIIYWTDKIPKFTKKCKCKDFWMLWKKNNPPTYDKYFQWTVDAHNAVNIKLEKPVFNLEEAKKLYININYSFDEYLDFLNKLKKQYQINIDKIKDLIINNKTEFIEFHSNQLNNTEKYLENLQKIINNEMIN